MIPCDERFESDTAEDWSPMMDESSTYPSLSASCWFLTGPTASGKTAIAVGLAEKIGAEILSLDSMAVYRRMDLGTAKPPQEARDRVSHHMIDLVDPNVEFSVSEYLRGAHTLVKDLQQRGKQVLFVGGSPLYLKGCIRGFDAGPPADWEFRKAIDEEVEQFGIEALRQRLEQVDPLLAHQLHPNDKRRMVRALEVARSTGTPLSHRQVQFETHRPSHQANVYALRWERATLHKRIEERVEQMFEDGLVDEVKRLREDYAPVSRTASQAVGYREVFDYLDGHSTLDDAIERVKIHSRQLARRQETWFRSTEEVQFIEMQSDRSTDSVVDEILSIAKENGTLAPVPVPESE